MGPFVNPRLTTAIVINGQSDIQAMYRRGVAFVLPHLLRSWEVAVLYDRSRFRRDGLGRSFLSLLFWSYDGRLELVRQGYGRSLGILLTCSLD
jgi:hypothetical protein